MKLSILTPSRNYGRFLLDAIQSVARQEDELVEHIVVDGDSTDDTLEILQGCKEVRYVSEPDNGQSDALNKAVHIASGDWCGWLNADEFYLPDAFEVVRAVLADHPGADVVYGDCCFVDTAGRFLRLVPQHPFHPRILRWYGPFISSCATFFRTASLRRLGWDVHLRRIMDWDLYMALADQDARFVHVAHPMAAFRLHDAQVTADSQSSWPEGRYVRLRHGMPSNRPASAVLFQMGRLEHGMRKLAGNAYARQRRASRQLKGADLRWFASEESEREALLLANLVSKTPKVWCYQ